MLVGKEYYAGHILYQHKRKETVFQGTTKGGGVKEYGENYLFFNKIYFRNKEIEFLRCFCK